LPRGWSTRRKMATNAKLREAKRGCHILERRKKKFMDRGGEVGSDYDVFYPETLKKKMLSQQNVRPKALRRGPTKDAWDFSVAGRGPRHSKMPVYGKERKFYRIRRKYSKNRQTCSSYNKKTLGRFLHRTKTSNSYGEWPKKMPYD